MIPRSSSLVCNYRIRNYQSFVKNVFLQHLQGLSAEKGFLIMNKIIFLTKIEKITKCRLNIAKSDPIDVYSEFGFSTPYTNQNLTSVERRACQGAQNPNFKGGVSFVPMVEFQEIFFSNFYAIEQHKNCRKNFPEFRHGHE